MKRYCYVNFAHLSFTHLCLEPLKSNSYVQSLLSGRLDMFATCPQKHVKRYLDHYYGPTPIKNEAANTTASLHFLEPRTAWLVLHHVRAKYLCIQIDTNKFHERITTIEGAVPIVVNCHQSITQAADVISYEDFVSINRKC